MSTTDEQPWSEEAEMAAEAERRRQREIDYAKWLDAQSIAWLHDGDQVPQLAADTIARRLVRTDTMAMRSLSVEGLTVLSGGVGCGKTLAASWWLWQRARESLAERIRLEDPWFVPVHWSPGRFVTASGLARWKSFDPHECKALFRSRYLVLDDLGREYADKNGYYLTLLDELIDERYSRKLATVITTNLDEATFGARYGGRVVDRLREVGRWCNVNAPSMRGKRS